MSSWSIRFSAVVGAALALSLGASSAFAAWPERPITIVATAAPGGSTDILARVIAEPLSRALGQPVIVENRAGASGNIGSDYVARAKPDGYTLVVNPVANHAINQFLYKHMSYRAIDDFAPIALLAYVRTTLVVHPSIPAKTVQELVAYGKAHPGVLSYASGGVGSIGHIGGAMLAQMAGFKMEHVPYKGGAPAALDVVAGRVPVFFSAGALTLPYVRSGRLNLLAITDRSRSAVLPDVPTIGETVPGYAMDAWYGVLAPAGTPHEIIERLNVEINKIMTSREVRKKMADMAIDVAAISPQEFAAIIRDDARRYGKLITELNITADE